MARHDTTLNWNLVDLCARGDGGWIFYRMLDGALMRYRKGERRLERVPAEQLAVAKRALDDQHAENERA